MRYFVELDDDYEFLSVGKLYSVDHHDAFLDDGSRHCNLQLAHGDTFVTLVIEL